MKQSTFQPQENIISMVSSEEEEPVQDTELEEESLDEQIYNYMN